MRSSAIERVLRRRHAKAPDGEALLHARQDVSSLSPRRIRPIGMKADLRQSRPEEVDLVRHHATCPFVRAAIQPQKARQPQLHRVSRTV